MAAVMRETSVASLGLARYVLWRKHFPRFAWRSGETATPLGKAAPAMTEAKAEKATLDINAIRDPTIQSHDLPGVDETYTLYYDETNNIRLLHITADGLNAPVPGCFVLGGIAHRGSSRPLDLADLRKRISMQANADEMKFKHVAKGDWMTILGSQRLYAVLGWIRDQGLLIHYSAIDTVYWAIVDLVEAVLHPLGHDVLLIYGAQIKDALYAALRVDFDPVLDLFREFGFPTVIPGRSAAFAEALYYLLDDRRDRVDVMQQFGLELYLNSAKRAVELPLIEGAADAPLVEGFSPFFLHRICLFKNADHILDEEGVVEATLEGFQLSDGAEPYRRYRFADSKSEPGIQVSDVVVGTIARCLDYALRTDQATIVSDLQSMNQQQLANYGLLNMLLADSNATCPALLHYSLALSEVRKASLLLG